MKKILTIGLTLILILSSCGYRAEKELLKNLSIPFENIRLIKLRNPDGIEVEVTNQADFEFLKDYYYSEEYEFDSYEEFSDSNSWSVQIDCGEREGGGFYIDEGGKIGCFIMPDEEFGTRCLVFESKKTVADKAYIDELYKKYGK